MQPHLFTFFHLVHDLLVVRWYDRADAAFLVFSSACQRAKFCLSMQFAGTGSYGSMTVVQGVLPQILLSDPHSRAAFTVHASGSHANPAMLGAGMQ